MGVQELIAHHIHGLRKNANICFEWYCDMVLSSIKVWSSWFRTAQLRYKVKIAENLLAIWACNSVKLHPYSYIRAHWLGVRHSWLTVYECLTTGPSDQLFALWGCSNPWSGYYGGDRVLQGRPACFRRGIYHTLGGYHQVTFIAHGIESHTTQRS